MIERKPSLQELIQQYSMELIDTYKRGDNADVRAELRPAAVREEAVEPEPVEVEVIKIEPIKIEPAESEPVDVAEIETETEPEAEYIISEKNDGGFGDVPFDNGMVLQLEPVEPVFAMPEPEDADGVSVPAEAVTADGRVESADDVVKRVYDDGFDLEKVQFDTTADAGADNIADSALVNQWEDVPFDTTVDSAADNIADNAPVNQWEDVPFDSEIEIPDDRWDEDYPAEPEDFWGGMPFEDLPEYIFDDEDAPETAALPAENTEEAASAGLLRACVVSAYDGCPVPEAKVQIGLRSGDREYLSVVTFTGMDGMTRVFDLPDELMLGDSMMEWGRFPLGERDYNVYVLAKGFMPQAAKAIPEKGGVAEAEIKLTPRRIL